MSRLCEGQSSQSKPEKLHLILLALPVFSKEGNSLLHLEQLFVALCPTKLQTFRVAGISHMQQVNAAQIKTFLEDNQHKECIRQTIAYLILLLMAVSMSSL